jgi:hypothetical protein
MTTLSLAFILEVCRLPPLAFQFLYLYLHHQSATFYNLFAPGTIVPIQKKISLETINELIFTCDFF